jgi:hypothetical protein
LRDWLNSLVLSGTKRATVLVNDPPPALIAVLGWLRFTPLLTLPTARSLLGAATTLHGLLVGVGGLMLRVVNSRAGFVPASVTPVPDPGGPI